jgi:imidazolonepropionase-like amidohydrolase/Tol biopolymer transport system component
MLPQLWSTLTLLIITCVVSSLAQTPTKARRETITIRVQEGTDLSFDLSSDGRSIVFDLLGQLWLIPARGGKARAITNAIRDTAEDLDPSFAPDGRSLVFGGERNGRTGLWLLNLDSGQVRQLTQLSDPDGFDREGAWSPDGRVIAFSRAVPPSPSSKGRFGIFLLDVASGTTRELSITGVDGTFFSDPVWVGGGKIAFVARKTPREPGGRIWIVAAAGGPATPISAASLQARAPSFSADAKLMAYFILDSKDRPQVWVQEIDGNNTAKGPPVQVSDYSDVTPTRIRWYPNSSALLYSANGRLWKVSASGGQPTEIRFNAELSFTRARRVLPDARFPEPGRKEPARGFMGLALSPDGRQIGTLALGKLWIVPIGGIPRAVADVPFEATSLAWSPDGTDVAWSAGVDDNVDLFATNLTTGATRKITSLPGRETFPTYSPDGRHLAFLHSKDENGVLRVIDSKANNVADLKHSRDLGSISLNGTCTPRWSPKSDGLLVCGEAVPNQPGRATFVPLSGQRQELTRFPDAPIFLQWTPQNKIVFVRHDRLWEVAFDHTGMRSDPKPLGNSAALYASSSCDGTLLFVSNGGLKLRSPEGNERKLGWPISYTPPIAEAMLIRNVRIIDGTGGLITAARDILIKQGRIARIAPTGTISSAGPRVLDAAGRIVMPGLMDLHAHLYRPDLLPGWIYFGVTTVRDQGASMAPLVAYADDFASGVLPGPRVGYGGFQFYSDWAFDEEQGRGIEPEADPDHIRRAVDLAQAFGAQHIKTRTFRRWDINARMITEAHRRGMRATGHCSQQLPLVAAGMDAKEHIGLCGFRGNKYIYDDLIQLFRAADIGVVPTITYVDLAVRLNQRPMLLDGDTELAPFMPAKENFDWMVKLSAEAMKSWTEDVHHWRAATAKLSRAGVTIGTGTDIWQIPTGVHMELEQLVAAGLTPLQAIRAGTSDAARILGADKELGTIEPGKWADLILLDADPLLDIRNTRKIWHVIHNGHLVDRQAILKSIKRQ